MQNGFVLEVCVESLDCAQASERGGAQRIELCSNLSIGGTTPSAGTMRTARKDVGIPIHVLIRPRGGDFVYSDPEFEIMKRDICIVKELGMDGIVLGVLDEKQRIDVKRTSKLVKLAHPLPVTFHRAFDLCSRPGASLEAVIEAGARRLLTSGGKGSAIDGLTSLARLLAAAQDRIVIMPGGGVRANNVMRILRQTGAREIHTSLGSFRTLSRGSRQTVEFEARVSKFRRLMDAIHPTA
jgi:copper homeostasis protein